MTDTLLTEADWRLSRDSKADILLKMIDTLVINERNPQTLGTMVKMLMDTHRKTMERTDA